METKANILLDARKLADAGIGVYIENLVEGLLPQHEEGALRLSLLVREQRPSTVLQEAAAAAIARWKERLQVVAENAGDYSLSEYLLLGLRRRKLLRGCSIYHSPHYVLPYFLPIPAVVTIHDVIHIDQPESFYHRPAARALIRSAVRRAAHVITVSSASLSRLAKVVGAASTPITVVPNGLRRGIGVQAADKVRSFARAHELEDPYYLYVGSDRPHKGFQQLMHAWRLLRILCLREGIGVPQLLLIGSRFGRAAHGLVKTLKLEQQVRFLGEVPLAELTLYYNAAHGVVVPSLEEGFGFAALEGMACGSAVICTPESSLKEVCGNCAWYSEDYSAESVCAAVFASYVNPELSEAKADRGIVRAQEFDRQLVAQRTLDVYEQVLNPLAFQTEDDELGKAPRISYGPKEVFEQHLRRAL